MTATKDTRTKAKLLEALEQAEDRASDAEANAYRAEQRVGVSPGLTPVPEASALAACIRALDSLRDDRQSSMSYQSFGNGHTRPDLNTTQRVIEALAVKYKMPPAEIRELPCVRKHVEDMSPGDLVEAIRGRGY